MDILRNIGTNISTNTEIGFINKYGNLSLGYKTVGPLGNQKQTGYIGIMVILLFILIGLFVATKDTIDPETKKVIPKTTVGKLLNYLKYGVLIMFIGSVGYSVYFYIFIYLVEYNKWFSSLPLVAKSELASINTMRNVLAQAAQMNRNIGTEYKQPTNSLINIKLFGGNQ